MTLTTLRQFLIFSVADTKLAISLSLVDQVYSAVEIDPLPEAPETVFGLINVHGAIIVVLNLRRKLNLPERSVELSDQLLIANLEDRQFALLVDDVEAVVQLQAEQILTEDNSPSKQTIYLNEEAVEVISLADFLSPAQQDQLNSALQMAYIRT